MDELSLKAIAAKNNERIFEDLVQSRKSWILKAAADASGHYVTDSDDEWSVALMAFNEAVQKYDEKKGNFQSLASKVIKCRVIDCLRSQKRYSGEIPVIPDAFDGSLSEDDANGIDLKVQERIKQISLDENTGQRAGAVREEIGEIQEILHEYGFSFFDLAENSPKAEKTKKSCGRAIRTLIASAVLMALMRLKRMLPVKKLSEKSGVIIKIIERHRKYIIASAEILDGDFPILASYLKCVKEEQDI